MWRLIMVLMAGAWAFSGWRNMPRLHQPYAAAAGFVIATCIYAAFWAGTRHAASKVIARAEARADARAAALSAAHSRAEARQVVIVKTEGARAEAEVEYGGEPEWVLGPKHAAIDEETALNVIGELHSDYDSTA